MDKRRPGFPSNPSSSSSSYASSTPSSSNLGGTRKRTEIFNMFKSVAGLNTSSTQDSTGKGRSKLPGNRVTHGFHLVKGKSGHEMEDYHVAEYRHINGQELGLFAIFDGHLGDRVPSYLKANLFPNIIEQPDFWYGPEAAIRNAYRSTDEFILQNASHMGPGGSTAVTAIVINGKDLWIANIGDSRAVLCERGSANQLTVDHEPHTERGRIEKQGGFVTFLPGDVSRVNGQLAVARAFGDQGLKEHLTSEPDVRHVPIDSTIEFVILASDGLWKKDWFFSRIFTVGRSITSKLKNYTAVTIIWLHSGAMGLSQESGHGESLSRQFGENCQRSASCRKAFDYRSIG